MRNPLRIVKKCFAVAAFAALAACATPTPYQPMAAGQGGYRTQQVGPDHFLITFSGNEVTPRETVETYLLYRAAQVTLQSGNDYFVLVNKDTQRAADYWVSPDPFWGGPYGWGPYGWGWGGPYGWGYGGTVHTVQSYHAFADIAVRKGPKPEALPNAYDARGVVASLGPAIQQAASGNPGHLPPAR